MTTYRLRAVRDWMETAYLVVTPSQAAKSMFFYVQEVGHLQTMANFCTEREGLCSFLILYTVSGKGYLKYEGKDYTVEPNQAFLIDCENYQYYDTDKEDLWEYKWIHFYGGASRGYYDQYKKNSNGPVITFQDDSISGYIQQLIEINRKKDARTEILSSKLITDLLTELLLNGKLQDQELIPNFLPDYISKVLDYLENKYSEKIMLDQLAAKFGVSKYHMIREFKKYIGQTPNEYLINIRINQAKDLLKNTYTSVVDIAEQTGFGNVSHFIDTFKKHEELTPLNYRQLWR